MNIKLNQLFQAEDEIYTKIFNSISEGVIVADAKGEFLFFNNAANEILGIDIQDVELEKWSEVYGCFFVDQKTPFPSEQLPLAQTINKGVKRKETIFIKNKIHPEGVFIDITSIPIFDSDNFTKGGIIFFKDITEQKKSEILSRQSEVIQKAQFKGFPIPTYVWKNIGKDFKLIEYNDAADKFTNGKARKILNTSLSKMYPDPSSPIFCDTWASFNNKNTINREMTYLLQSTGETKELNVYYNYIPPDLVMVHTEDITSRKEQNILLQKLSNAVEQTADAVLLTNNKGKIEYVNPAFEDMTGFKKTEAIGKTPRILKSGKHPQVLYKNLWNVLLKGNPYKSEMINKKKNGEFFWIQNTITPIKDSNNKILNFVSVIKDITEIKAKKEQEIRMRVAQEIQQRLFISDVNIPGYDIAGKNFPTDETGGDYFDIILSPDGSLWLTIADVSNHGIGPALIMAETRAFLRAFIKTTSDPAEILALLNNELYSDLDEFQYVTLLLMRLNTKNNNEVKYAGAGHVPGYLISNTGTVKHVLKSTGIPLGYKKDVIYKNSTINNTYSGDILVCMTDGIIEAQDRYDNEFGYEKILNLVKFYKNETSQKIIEEIFSALSEFNQKSKFEDDITALICKINDVNKHF